MPVEYIEWARGPSARTSKDGGKGDCRSDWWLRGMSIAGSRLALQFKQIRATFSGAKPEKRADGAKIKKGSGKVAARVYCRTLQRALLNLMRHLVEVAGAQTTKGARPFGRQMFYTVSTFYLPYKLKSNTCCLIKKNVGHVYIFMLARVYIYAYRTRSQQGPADCRTLATQYFSANEREKSCASRLQHILYVLQV